MFRAVFFSLALALSASAEDHALVKATNYWRVLGVTSGGTQPDPNWTQPDFDDSTWPLFQASFVRRGINYLGTAETTILPEGPQTFCFRAPFKVEDPGFVKWLSLRIDHESGFVAYLNGREVARRTFPISTAPVPLTTFSDFHTRGPTETIDLSEHIAKLLPGTNVLAIQLHTAETNGGLLLATELVANFIRGPFIQNTTTNSTQVIWHTLQPTTGFVAFGKDPANPAMVAADISATNHAVTLPGLEAGQTYYYRVHAQTDTEVATSDWYTFRTLKARGSPITFTVLGDTGVGTTPQFKIADQMRAQNPDLVMHAGDIVYFCFQAAHVDARCFSIYRDQMRSTPYFFALGNHDTYCGAGDYFDAFYLPTNDVGTEHYYSFDHGDAHFVVLHTETPSGARYDPGSPQYIWLENDLATTRQPWKFIFFHHVFRTSSIHSTDDYFPYNGPGSDRVELQAYIGGLASRYGVQAIFNGHDHDFERFAALNGVNSFVCGGGGAALYPQSSPDTGFNEGSAQFHMRQSFVKVTVNGDEMMTEAIDDNGVVFDRFYRSQSASGPGPIASKWGSPNVEASMGSDPAGNIPGQTFDFTGDSIRTRAGVHANLGRIHVRNDQNLLYVGFETASIWRNQAIALFLENPARPGITDLAPLGNGVIDNEDGQGADGLDMLTKLSFRNFRPSIGCLLGDERVDGNDRTFQRLYMRWPVGQGVFHLDQNLSIVPRARLQQFARSPQTLAPQFFDANADFIEIAIPLYELANPQLSGGQIKLGAIVISDPASGEMIPEIDTSFAGAALDAGANGTFTLEPVTIQLAPDPDFFHDGFAFMATVLSDDKLHFEWNSVPTATYTIEASPALGQLFAPLNVPGLPITATGPRTMFDLTIDGSSPRFYRLRAN